MKCGLFGYGKWIDGKRELWSKRTTGDAGWRMIDDDNSWQGNGVKHFGIRLGSGFGGLFCMHWYWYCCCLRPRFEKKNVCL